MCSLWSIYSDTQGFRFLDVWKIHVNHEVFLVYNDLTARELFIACLSYPRA